MTKLRAYTEQPFNSVNSCNTFIYLPCYNNHECLNMMLESLLNAIQIEREGTRPQAILKHPKNSQQTNEGGLSHSCQHPNTSSYRLLMNK